MEARWLFVFLGAMALIAMAMPAVRADSIDLDRRGAPADVEWALPPS